MNDRRDHTLLGMPYRGYEIPYCGMGTIVARRPDGSEIRVDCKGSPWLERAWDQLREIIDRELDA